MTCRELGDFGSSKLQTQCYNVRALRYNGDW
jgi:hypothetical protein